jgi:cyanophycinase
MLITLLTFLTPGRAAAAQQVGPSYGSLVIVGGAMRGPAIVERFLHLAGGPAAPIVVIPTAGGGAAHDASWEGLRPFRAAGATRFIVRHTTDRAVSDSEAFVAAIRDARGVWFAGGRQWRLADAYLHTRVHEELEALLARGGVIGGSSAGATFLGSYLARGDTATNTVMMGDHEEGWVCSRMSPSINISSAETVSSIFSRSSPRSRSCSASASASTRTRRSSSKGTSLKSSGRATW